MAGGAWLPGLLLAALVMGRVAAAAGSEQTPSPEAPLARTMPRVAFTLPPPLENR